MRTFYARIDLVIGATKAVAMAFTDGKEVGVL